MERRELVDRVYEAAFLPDSWPAVLQRIAEAAGSVSGSLLVFEESRPIRYKATPLIQPWTEAFCSEFWKTSNRLSHCRKKPYVGFAILNQYFSMDFLENDPSHVYRLSNGLDSEIAAAIPMPTGEMVVFSFDRLKRDGPHGKEDRARLNEFYRHLARAGLIAARLGLERAVTTASTLQLIGLPSAVLSASGTAVCAALWTRPTLRLVRSRFTLRKASLRQQLPRT